MEDPLEAHCFDKWVDSRHDVETGENVSTPIQVWAADQDRLTLVSTARTHHSRSQDQAHDVG